MKTLRFYADEELVPASQRSESGYRLYSDADVLKLDLVRTLRDAGLGLAAIRAVLAHDMTLAEALRLRLGAIEAHIASLKQVAAALRVALRSEPTEQDIRRLTAVTRLSHEERKSLIEGFYSKVSEGIPIDKEWMRAKIEASAPRLPDEPSPEQLDAWVELSDIISDPAFVASLRDNAREVWSRGLDLEKLLQLNQEIVADAKAARAEGATPESDIGKAIAERYALGLAELSGQSPDNTAFRAGVRQRFERQDPRATRYWELVGILRGGDPMMSQVAEWKFVSDAVKAHLPLEAH